MKGDKRICPECGGDLDDREPRTNEKGTIVAAPGSNSHWTPRGAIHQHLVCGETTEPE